MSKLTGMSEQPLRGDERRKHTRVAASWPVHLALPEGAFTAELRDISVSGVCFFLDRPIPEMTLLQLNLGIPVESGEEVTIQGEGVVVRCAPLSPHLDHYEVAVFFNSLPSADREVLAAFVSRRASPAPS